MGSAKSKVQSKLKSDFLLTLNFVPCTFNFQNVSLNPICAVRFCPVTAVRYVALLSTVSIEKLFRLNTLKTSAMPSIEMRPESFTRCWTRMSVRFCAGWMNALRATRVPSGRRRALKVPPVWRTSPPKLVELRMPAPEVVADAAAGEHTVAVRVTDDYDNQAAEKVIVK